MRKQFNLEYYLAHPETKVVTRDGRSVRILCTDLRNNDYQIVASFISYLGCGEEMDTFTSEGKCVPNTSVEYDRDLFFDLPDPVKKRIPLTYEDLLDRIKSGKTMWVKCKSLEGCFQLTSIMKYDGRDCYSTDIRGLVPTSFLLKEYSFVDGTPCWKEVEE